MPRWMILANLRLHWPALSHMSGQITLEAWGRPFGADSLEALRTRRPRPPTASRGTAHGRPSYLSLRTVLGSSPSVGKPSCAKAMHPNRLEKRKYPRTYFAAFRCFMDRLFMTAMRSRLQGVELLYSSPILSSPPLRPPLTGFKPYTFTHFSIADW